MRQGLSKSLSGPGWAHTCDTPASAGRRWDSSRGPTPEARCGPRLLPQGPGPSLLGRNRRRARASVRIIPPAGGSRATPLATGRAAEELQTPDASFPRLRNRACASPDRGAATSGSADSGAGKPGRAAGFWRAAGEGRRAGRAVGPSPKPPLTPQSELPSARPGSGDPHGVSWSRSAPPGRARGNLGARGWRRVLAGSSAMRGSLPVLCTLVQRDPRGGCCQGQRGLFLTVLFNRKRKV